MGKVDAELESKINSFGFAIQIIKYSLSYILFFLLCLKHNLAPEINVSISFRSDFMVSVFFNSIVTTKLHSSVVCMYICTYLSLYVSFEKLVVPTIQKMSHSFAT